METWQGVKELIWTHYDDSDEWVVCSVLSGEVHLVSHAVHSLWTLACDHHVRSGDEFVSLLAAEAGRAADDELASATKDTLAFMDEAGLLKRVSI